MKKLIIAAAVFATSAFAQTTTPTGMVALTQAEQLAYRSSCTTKEGLQHTCQKGMVVAITADGTAMCRPDTRTLPFARKGEKPCTNEKLKVAEAAPQ